MCLSQQIYSRPSLPRPRQLAQGRRNYWRHPSAAMRPRVRGPLRKNNGVPVVERLPRPSLVALGIADDPWFDGMPAWDGGPGAPMSRGDLASLFFDPRTLSASWSGGVSATATHPLSSAGSYAMGAVVDFTVQVGEDDGTPIYRSARADVILGARRGPGCFVLVLESGWFFVQETLSGPFGFYGLAVTPNFAPAESAPASIALLGWSVPVLHVLNHSLYPDQTFTCSLSIQ